MPGCQMVQTLNGFQNLYKKSGLGMFLQWDLNTEHSNLEPIQNLNVFKDQYSGGLEFQTRCSDGPKSFGSSPNHLKTELSKWPL